MNSKSLNANRRILHVVATLERAGTEVSCLSLATALAANGVENHVVALTTGAGQIARAFEGVAQLHSTLPQKRIGRTLAFYQLCRELRPDAIIIHYFTIDHITLGACARLAGIRRLAIKQGNPPPLENAILRKKIGFILLATRVLKIKLVSASRWIEQSMREVGPLPTGSKIVYNGVNVAQIAACAAVVRANRTADGPYVIGMVARLDPIKDHSTLLNAIAHLPDRLGGRPVQVRLIGDGMMREALEGQARRLGIAARVEILGTRTDIASELGAMDVFVLSTTRDEGFGVVLIEALAAGTPVVASDVPACREVLTGGLGLLVPAGDPEALALALRSVITDPPAIPETAEIERRYGMAVMANGHWSVLYGTSQ